VGTPTKFLLSTQKRLTSQPFKGVIYCITINPEPREGKTTTISIRIWKEEGTCLEGSLLDRLGKETRHKNVFHLPAKRAEKRRIALRSS